jgi:dihydroflavonol-4-reductase
MNFVTGATGMLGTHLIGALIRKNLPVVAGFRSDSRKQQAIDLLRFQGFSKQEISSIQWRYCDVLDTSTLLDSLQGCKVIFHTSAVVSYHASDRALMYATNVEGTANVVNVAIELGDIKLIHVSSIAALGKSMPGATLNEDSEWKNSELNTHYGISKHLSDLEIWRGVQEGLDAIIMHPGFIIGAGAFDRSSPSVFQKINEGLGYYPPGGTGFIGAHDCAKIMLTLSQGNLKNEAYILVSHSESMQWLFQNVANSLGASLPRKMASPWVLHIARIAEWIKEMLTSRKALITKETVKNASIQFYYDNKKLMATLPELEFDIDCEFQNAAAYFIQSNSKQE